ncbi:MAG: hypothetical protein R2932_31130 [Caldilineaceae bacterium]
MSDNRKRALYGLLGTLGMVTVLALVFAAVHWAAARLYLRLGWQPPTSLWCSIHCWGFSSLWR